MSGGDSSWVKTTAVWPNNAKQNDEILTERWIKKNVNVQVRSVEEQQPSYRQPV